MTNDKPDIKVRATSKYIYYGVLIGEWFHPFRALVRDRSKYKPHQGKRECARRLRNEK